MKKQTFLIILIILSFGISVSAQSLPKPTGSYQIGTTVLHLVDKTRMSLIVGNPGKIRELMVQAWYPSDSSVKENTKATYLTNPAIMKVFLDEQYNFQSQSVIEGLKNVSTSAVLNAPVSKGQIKFPLLICSPGLGEPRSNYTALAQDLASHGYIVITVDHPYGGITILPDGRILTTNDDPRGGDPEGAAAVTEEWAKDASFIVNQLSSPAKSDSKLVREIGKKIDFQKVGMLGHSLGGAAALEACRADSRFKACADLDGSPFGKIKEAGVQRPTLVMRNNPVYSDEDLAKRGRTREQWEEMGREGKKNWDSILPKDKEVPLYSIKIVGAGHMSFSDAPFTMPDTITRFGGRIIDADLSFRIISGYTVDFFNKYLKKEGTEFLDKANPAFSEAIIEKYNVR